MLMRPCEILVLLLLAFCLNVPGAHASQPDETQVKAVFLLNFAKLTEWPADSRADSSTFIIAILGKAPSAAFVQTLQSQTVHGAKVSIRQVETVADAKGANIVYITGAERQRLSGILREFGQQNILTVSDIPGFCEAGGMIGMVPVQRRLGFEVNQAALRKTRLTVSSQLLKLAKNIFGN